MLGCAQGVSTAWGHRDWLFNHSLCGCIQTIPPSSTERGMGTTASLQLLHSQKHARVLGFPWSLMEEKKIRFYVCIYIKGELNFKNEPREKLSSKDFLPYPTYCLNDPQIILHSCKIFLCSRAQGEVRFHSVLWALIQVISALFLLHPHPSHSLPPAQTG